MSAEREDVSMRYLTSAFSRGGIDGTLRQMVGEEGGAQKAQYCSSCGELIKGNALSPSRDVSGPSIANIATKRKWRRSAKVVKSQ